MKPSYITIDLDSYEVARESKNNLLIKGEAHFKNMAEPKLCLIFLTRIKFEEIFKKSNESKGILLLSKSPRTLQIMSWDNLPNEPENISLYGYDVYFPIDFRIIP